jgi:hypothetical protein
MKEIIMVGFVFTLTLTGCFPIPPPQAPPYGVWQSEEPEITLYIIYGFGDELDNTGVYKKNGNEIELLLEFGPGRRFKIYDKNTDFSEINSYLQAYYTGTYRLRGNRDNRRMVYTLVPYWQERTGVERIIFTKVGDVHTPTSHEE